MRCQASGQFELPISASEAIDYFTLEGERSWAPGWDPTYPAGGVSEAPGTVFITSHGEDQTIWTVGLWDPNLDCSTTPTTIATTTTTAATTTTTSPGGPCDPSYPDHCIPPPPPDLNCPDIPWTDFRVLPPDPHGFDGNDNDGIGCET